MPTTYSNPRLYAEIPNWPMGGTHRGVAIFAIEARPGKGERATRVTRRYDHPKATAPKTLTFSVKQRIVDGDDGRTYVIRLTRYGHIAITGSDMQYDAEAAIFPDDPRYAAIRALFDMEA